MLGGLRIRYNVIDEPLEKICSRDKFDTAFVIEDCVNCSEDTNGD